jgi:hypothetical protein
MNENILIILYTGSYAITAPLNPSLPLVRWGGGGI